ncbi:Ankyrin Repeat Protein [Geosmithia morbida]|uniref:Ankyrin Repeat Protein n=1 Tax=Geosmithia morbida TaxID=1094350 RepID=A0A9P5D7U1_9HYPO|nr:Ankyrin Repeat Protein [Geosmithia morbida]KAF4126095.1 Ankyrin Repeat Protein [Geosmithia morbida]
MALPIANKANVNTMHRFGDLGRITTPLALAVHRSSYEWAEKLLQKGADPNIGCDFVANQLLSHLLGHYPEYDDARPSLNCVWRPLVLAVGMGDEPLVRLLVENGALDVVSEPKETSDGIPSSFPPAGDVTVHHIYATGPLAGVDTIEFLLRSFPESVNAAVDGWKTPLTMAISSRKFDAFEALLQAAAEVNYPDGPLVPPLHAAIETFWLSTEPASRSICVQFMHRLIQRGADVNRIYNGSSPLTAVLGGISCSETKQLLPSMFPIVQMLIQGQADVNYMDPSGKTPMCIIFDKATLTWDFRTCTFLQQPLSQLFAAGADVNKHGPNRETSLFSLLKAFFLDPAANVSAAFIQCTVAYGAVLGDDEANRMFIRWLDNAWFQKTYRMARYHGKRISKEILFQAYEGAIKQRDMKKLKALGAFGEPANTDVVLSLAFHPAYYNRQVIERSRGWRFDANFTDAEDSGRGYMHKIIRVLECNKGYREKQATRDLQQLLLRRCRPGLLDAGGKTALERLRMMANKE